MAQPIITNRYKLPPGYSAPRTLFGTFYQTPWNGFLSGYNSPGAVIFGEVDLLQFLLMPNDGDVFSLVGPNGVLYEFQFIDASVWITGIKIDISGTTSPDEVITRMLQVMQEPSALDVDGNRVYFHWVASEAGLGVLALEWNVAGSVTNPLFPSSIIFLVTNAFGSSNCGFVASGRVGSLPATLPPKV